MLHARFKELELHPATTMSCMQTNHSLFYPCTIILHTSHTYFDLFLNFSTHTERKFKAPVSHTLLFLTYKCGHARVHGTHAAEITNTYTHTFSSTHPTCAHTHTHSLLFFSLVFSFIYCSVKYILLNIPAGVFNVAQE